MRRNFRDQSEPCSSDRKIPKMVLLIAPSMAMVASSPAIDPWINIESTQGFLTPLGFEMTCFWMVHPQLSFRAKREISSFLDRRLPRRPIGLLAMTSDERTLTNKCHFEDAVKRRPRNPYYDPLKIPLCEAKETSSPETYTLHRNASGISHPLRGFEMTSTETFRPPLSLRALRFHSG